MLTPLHLHWQRCNGCGATFGFQSRLKNLHCVCLCGHGGAANNNKSFRHLAHLANFFQATWPSGPKMRSCSGGNSNEGSFNSLAIRITCNMYETCWRKAVNSYAIHLILQLPLEQDENLRRLCTQLCPRLFIDDKLFSSPPTATHCTDERRYMYLCRSWCAQARSCTRMFEQLRITQIHTNTQANTNIQNDIDILHANAYVHVLTGTHT